MCSALVALAVVFVGCFSFALAANSTYSYNVSAGDTAISNITGMIEDMVPSFVLLIFVMAFMLMLLNMVDRVGHKN